MHLSVTTPHNKQLPIAFCYQYQTQNTHKFRPAALNLALEKKKKNSHVGNRDPSSHHDIQTHVQYASTCTLNWCAPFAAVSQKALKCKVINQNKQRVSGLIEVVSLIVRSRFHMRLYGVRWEAQNKKQELWVKRLQAEHRETYLFLGSSTQNPKQKETEQDNMNGGK